MNKLLNLLHYVGGHGTQHIPENIHSDSNETEKGCDSSNPVVNIKISQGLTSYVNPGEVVRIQKERAQLISEQMRAASLEDSPAPVDLSG